MEVRPDSEADWQEESTVRRDRLGSSIRTWIHLNHSPSPLAANTFIIFKNTVSTNEGYFERNTGGLCYEEAHVIVE